MFLQRKRLQGAERESSVKSISPTTVTGFDSKTCSWYHMWVEFVPGSLFCCGGFCPCFLFSEFTSLMLLLL